MNTKLVSGVGASDVSIEIDNFGESCRVNKSGASGSTSTSTKLNALSAKKKSENARADAPRRSSTNMLVLLSVLGMLLGGLISIFLLFQYEYVKLD